MLHGLRSYGCKPQQHCPNPAMNCSCGHSSALAMHHLTMRQSTHIHQSPSHQQPRPKQSPPPLLVLPFLHIEPPRNCQLFLRVWRKLLVIYMVCLHLHIAEQVLYNPHHDAPSLHEPHQGVPQQFSFRDPPIHPCTLR
eukprot:Lithocolla_globosa_v1_NODE_7679_length_915_cov_5.501163.p2 type:complete len:138 gc:universal NODE_7679_length_915_cov_5.501163:416-3(-)